MSNNQFFPLTIHNNTNDQIVCRYMKGGALGTAEKIIGPRGQSMISDAYMGMSIYAANSFDPSTPYASMHVTQNADEVHFTTSGGGYGRGGPVGPPPAMRDVAYEESRVRVKARNKEKRAEMAAAEKNEMLPGDAADMHGTGLSAAYGGDLLHQGGGQGGAIDGIDDENGGQIYVPGMGYMNPEAIPPELMRQLQMREQAMAQSGVQQQTSSRPPFPDYDSQSRARALDGEQPLPPIKIPRREDCQDGGMLASAETFVASVFVGYLGMTPTNAERYARPFFIFILCGLLFAAMYVYNQRNRKKKVLHRGFNRRFRP